MSSVSRGLMYLFGGDRSWDPREWVACDDRIRGGSSQSFLDCTATNPIARFYGVLDTQTLGGAGFASQQTAANDVAWDLTDYDGIEVVIVGASAKATKDKRFTLNLKDTLPKRRTAGGGGGGGGDINNVGSNDGGHDLTSISWEFDFTPSQLPPLRSISGIGAGSGINDEDGDAVVALIPFSKLQATYRGRNVDRPRPLRLRAVRAFSIMNRSFFAAQHGTFELSIRSIAAVTLPPATIVPRAPAADPIDVDDDEESGRASGTAALERPWPPLDRALWTWRFGIGGVGCVVLLALYFAHVHAGACADGPASLGVSLG